MKSALQKTRLTQKMQPYITLYNPIYFFFLPITKACAVKDWLRRGGLNEILYCKALGVFFCVFFRFGLLSTHCAGSQQRILKLLRLKSS